MHAIERDWETWVSSRKLKQDSHPPIHQGNVRRVMRARACHAVSSPIDGIDPCTDATTGDALLRRDHLGTAPHLVPLGRNYAPQLGSKVGLEAWRDPRKNLRETKPIRKPQKVQACATGTSFA